MAKGVYIGVDNKARKVKSIYIGVDNKARKVKKAYIGVGGKARLFFSSGELIYKGRASWVMSNTLSNSVGLGIGNYAVITGGYWGSTVTNVFVWFDSNLTYGASEYGLQYGRIDHIVAKVGNGTGLVVGGKPATSTLPRTIDVISTNMSLSTISNGMSVGSRYLVGGSIGDYAVYLGGSAGSLGEAYNSNLTKTSTSSAISISGAMSANTANHLIICGGYNGSTDNPVNYAYAIDKNLTLTSCTTTFEYARYSHSGVSVGGRAVFAGGRYSKYADNETSVVTSYNDSLTFSTLSNLQSARYQLGAVSIGEYGIVGPGRDRAQVDYFDANLTRTNGVMFDKGYDGTDPITSNYATSTVGNYAIFCGGQSGGVYRRDTHVYQYN